MATTREGRELTRAHRVAQVNLATETQLEAAALFWGWMRDHWFSSRTTWMAATLLLMRSRWHQSQTLAAAYLSEYRSIEAPSPLGPVVELAFPGAAAARHLDVVPADLRLSPDDLAFVQQVEREVLGKASMTALAGGRSTIDLSSRAQRVRYRRVTDGTPCAFCATLASRGPRYSQETAYFRAHPGCGCGAEPVYGQWTPNAAELRWADAYQTAAEQARAAGQPLLIPHGRQRRDTILWRMRRNHPELFSDGIFPKAAQAA